MDLLAKRYASPFVVLEEMLRQGRLYEFVVEINSITFEEKRETKLWDIWLHKVFDKGWDEWNESVQRRARMRTATTAELEAAVRESMELLNNFNPTERG